MDCCECKSFWLPQSLCPVTNRFSFLFFGHSFGRPGVDISMRHVAEHAVLQILFVINEGRLITVCSDDSLHLWCLRTIGKKPEIVHSLKFAKERITYGYLPFQSRWLYLGTERGNVHTLNIDSFALSGYVINWNKVIEL